MGFNVLLVLHHFYIFVHLLKRCKNDCFALFVVLRTTCTTEDLLHVKNTNIFVCTCRTVVHFSPLNQHTVSWQVNTPRKCRGAAQYLDVSIVEHSLNQISIFPQHACMVGAEAVSEKLFYLFVSACVNVFLCLVFALTVEQL